MVGPEARRGLCATSLGLLLLLGGALACASGGTRRAAPLPEEPATVQEPLTPPTQTAGDGDEPAAALEPDSPAQEPGEGEPVAAAEPGSPEPEAGMGEPVAPVEPDSGMQEAGVGEPVAAAEPGSEGREPGGAADAAVPVEPASAAQGLDAGASAEPAAGGMAARRGVVVIVEGKAQEEEAVGLFEASQRARQERGSAPSGSAAGGAPLVITNQSLREKPAGGSITYRQTEENVAAAPIAPPAAAPGEEPTDDPGAGEESGQEDTGGAAVGTPADGGTAEPSLEQRNPELYWRTRIRDARLRWRESVERTEELAGLVGQLRYDFYATDDPWLRDSSIKPAWDRTLAEHEEARQNVDFQRRTVEAILEEGRRTGALPGWLREGLELEPDEEMLRRPAPFDEHRAIEPVETDGQ